MQWLMITFNSLIAASCAAIVSILLYLDLKVDKELPMWMRVPRLARGWFVVFIGFCGATHIFGIVDEFWPNAFLPLLVHGFAALTGLITVYVLWKKMPALIAIPKTANDLVQRSASLASQVVELKNRAMIQG